MIEETMPDFDLEISGFDRRSRDGLPRPSVHPNVANPRQGKTCKRAPDVAARRLGQDKAYLTVREILSLAQPQMMSYRASAAVFAGVGLQHQP